VNARPSHVGSVARCAIFLFGRLAVGGFFGYFELFWRNIWRIFVQDLDQCLVHKNVKIHLMLYTAAKCIVSESVRSFVPVPAASIQWKPCVWLSFRVQLDP